MSHFTQFLLRHISSRVNRIGNTQEKMQDDLDEALRLLRALARGDAAALRKMAAELDAGTNELAAAIEATKPPP